MDCNVLNTTNVITGIVGIIFGIIIGLCTPFIVWCKRYSIARYMKKILDKKNNDENEKNILLHLAKEIYNIIGERNINEYTIFELNTKFNKYEISTKKYSDIEVEYTNKIKKGGDSCGFIETFIKQTECVHNQINDAYYIDNGIPNVGSKIEVSVTPDNKYIILKRNNNIILYHITSQP